MASYDFRTQRLFVSADLEAGATVETARDQASYLQTVLRMRSGDAVLLFNGRDGEWLAQIAATGRRHCTLTVLRRTRPQAAPGTLAYCFAPLKRARLDYMVQKAVEMGAGVLQPVWTEHTQVSRLNDARMQANVIEAAEQCGVLAIPRIDPAQKLDSLLNGWDPEAALVFCDEAAAVADTASLLRPVRGKRLGLLIGPEGGFTEAERHRLRSLPFVVPISLGPRILRADTAAVAALAVVQLIAGDWDAARTSRDRHS